MLFDISSVMRTVVDRGKSEDEGLCRIRGCLCILYKYIYIYLFIKKDEICAFCRMITIFCLKCSSYEEGVLLPWWFLEEIPANLRDLWYIFPVIWIIYIYWLVLEGIYSTGGYMRVFCSGRKRWVFSMSSLFWKKKRWMLLDGILYRNKSALLR